MKRSFLLPAVAGFALVSSSMAIERIDQPPGTTPTADAQVSVSAPAAVTPVAPVVRAAPEKVHTSSAAEVVKMREAGLDLVVIRTYIQNLRVPYKATADDILYLHENKVPDELIADWIKRGGELVTLAAQVPASSPDLVAGANAQNQQPMVVQQQPPAVVYQSPQVTVPPTVVYSAPAYDYWGDYAYPYWYAPPISLGFSWGWGRPYWGGHYYGGFRGGPGYRGGFGGGHFGGHPGGVGGGHYGGGHFGGGGGSGGGHHR